MGRSCEGLSQRHIWGKHLLIFVCLGSREYQFNRLLIELDCLCDKGQITQEVFAQIGGSDYEPRCYKWERFLDHDRFIQKQDEADLIISHGGTGALVGALKKGKKVIAVPRLAQYGEHLDDHQTQISAVLAQEGYLQEVLNIAHLGGVIHEVLAQPIQRFWQKESRVPILVEEYLSEIIIKLENQR